jgi:hypothetical protein
MQKVVSGETTGTYRPWWLSITGFALFLLLMFLLGVLWLPRAAGDSRVVTGRSVELTGTHTDQQFISGDQVRILAQVADDIFAAGREVTLDGAKAHTLVVGARRRREQVAHALAAPVENQQDRRRSRSFLRSANQEPPLIRAALDTPLLQCQGG